MKLKITGADVTARSTFFLCILLLAGARASAQRLVFAHYMLTNQDYMGDTDPTQGLKIASYEREIREAQAIGIDGFALNAGGWLHQTYYIRYAAQMFEAAVRLHSGFKLMFSADMCCGNGIADVEDMMRRFAGNPRYSQVYFRHQGAFVLTTFAGDKLGITAWQQVRSDLATGANPSLLAEPTALSPAGRPPRNAPVRIFLVPAFFWGGELPSLSSLQPGFDEWQGTLDGFFYWGIAGVPGSGGALDQITSSHAYARILHGAGKLYMAPICFQFWGANANRYYEYSGAAGMRALWMDAIENTHPEWVEILTWNDFIEGTYISPIDDPNKYPGANFLNSTGVPLGTLGYFHSHAGATALLPFFIQWYKTGVEPTITHDAIYYFYRTQLNDADAATPPVAHKFGPVANRIYITANLTGPAELRITTGDRVEILRFPSGSTDEQAPIFAGDPPLLELMRKGQVVRSSRASDPIHTVQNFNDLYYSTGQITTP
jgi:hypothetical protein